MPPRRRGVASKYDPFINKRFRNSNLESRLQGRGKARHHFFERRKRIFDALREHERPSLFDEH